MNKTNKKSFGYQWLVILLVCISLSLATNAFAAPKPSLSLSKASWSVKNNQLLIKGTLKNSPAGTTIAINDLDGRRLGTVTPTAPAFELTLAASDLLNIPCSIRAQAGALELVKAVAGNPNKACSQAPKCQITAANNVKFANAINVSANTDVTFAAKASFASKKAKPKYEWDFSGGAMGENDAKNNAIESYKRATGTTAKVKFIRDNSRYLVHFSAVDGSVAALESKQYRCEDTIEVTVGNPPTDVPDMSAMVTESQQTAPKLGKELEGKKGDLVVLPYEDLTLQCDGDARMTPGGNEAGEFRYPNIRAVAYMKDLKSPLVTDINLRYSAASNSTDPVGRGSINSTSQNWPLNNGDIRTASSALDATIRKTDRWEDVTNDGAFDLMWWGLPDGYQISPDQGLVLFADPANGDAWPSSVPPPFYDTDHGRWMPGFSDPYNANDQQHFSGYDTRQGTYMARSIPLMDIDDTGRVNPFPLLRVSAYQDGNAQPVAETDVVQTSGKDFHCRECHAKGKIAANPATTYKASAFQYSLWNGDRNAFGGWDASAIQPEFFDSTDRNGQPSTNVADQEYAAVRNSASIHQFYDGMALLGQYTGGQKYQCGFSCHQEFVQQLFATIPYYNGAPDADEPFPLPAKSQYYYSTDYSMNMHKWHGQLQYTDAKDGILRDEKGVPLRWNPTEHSVGASNTRTLFPVKNATTGEILPMEQNCLKCHAGKREQCYRDRMYTAGVTCYQCHGDMLAVGKAYKKSQVNPDGFKLRVDLYDQPDCGSCHVGSANIGKSAPNEYFSAGVRKLAFEATDPSATSRSVDHSNPDAVRFAVPYTQVELVVTHTNSKIDNTLTSEKKALGIKTPLYRLGKDTHGNVPCGACHGGAHAVWPNRDTNANDNVTSLQLQGHTGTILECNVCHDKDAFKVQTDLDGSNMYSGDPKPGILGGPHNTHPINDPYWWKDSQDPNDTTAIDGSNYGGWHNNYALISGKAGEDQCAACHGNDHKGTRLSRTPVDRVFDFSSFDFAKLKKVGFKSKVIKVAAGTPIGCNTCHSIKTSCPANSPAGDQCGKPSGNTTPSTNQPPVFTAEPGAIAKTFVWGQAQAYSYTPSANDPDGDVSDLTFSLATRLDSMTIDPKTGEVKIPDWNGLTFPRVPYVYNYTITVNDGKGGYAYQRVPVTISCPSGQVWGYDPIAGSNGCVVNHDPVFAIKQLPMPTAVLAEPFKSVPLMASDSDLQTLQYSLDGAPSGMNIGGTNGILHWTPSALGAVNFTAKVSDMVGGVGSLPVTVHVCETGKTWSEANSACVSNQLPTITSTPTNGIFAYGAIYAGATVGEAYSYPVVVSDPDVGDNFTYSIYKAPQGMTIDVQTGVVTWSPTDSDESYTLGFTVAVSDGRGGSAIQSVIMLACPSGKHFSTEMVMCM